MGRRGGVEPGSYGDQDDVTATDDVTAKRLRGPDSLGRHGVGRTELTARIPSARG